MILVDGENNSGDDLNEATLHDDPFYLKIIAVKADLHSDLFWKDNSPHLQTVPEEAHEHASLTSPRGTLTTSNNTVHYCHHYYYYY